MTVKTNPSPMFPEFALDDCVWITYARLPTWTGFRVSSSIHSDDAVRILFAPEGRDSAALTDKEMDLVGWVVKNETEVHDAMLQQLFVEYPRRRTQFLGDYGDEDFADECVPRIDTPSDLKPLLDVISIYVHQLDCVGRPYVGVELDCTWDEEHGAGVLLHGTEPVDVGGADAAMTLWIAEGHAKKIRK